MKKGNTVAEVIQVLVDNNYNPIEVYYYDHERWSEEKDNIIQIAFDDPDLPFRISSIGWVSHVSLTDPHKKKTRPMTQVEKLDWLGEKSKTMEKPWRLVCREDSWNFPWSYLTYAPSDSWGVIDDNGEVDWQQFPEVKEI